MNKYTQPLANLVVSKGLQTGPFGSQLKAEEYTEDGIPVVMPKDIYGGKIKTDTIARTSIEKAKSLQKHFLQEGDILFPRRGDLGRIAVASKDNEGWICGTGCLRARLSEEVLPKYIHQFVLMPQVVRWLENNALGQTMLNLNTTIIGELPVYAPPMETQESIADALHTWDNAIEKTEALIAAKEKQFEWLRSHLISSSQANQTLKFGDFLTESRIPDTTQDPERRLTVRLHLKGVSVRDYRGTESTDATKYFHRKSGQLIYGKQNVFRGSIGIVPPNLDGYSSSQDIPAFDIADNVNSKWLYWYLSRPSFYSWLENFSAGSGSKRLHPKELFKISVDLPSLEDQKRISDSLNLADKEIRLLKKTLKQYRSQKRGLMQKLLTGEWQVGSSQHLFEDTYQEASA